MKNSKEAGLTLIETLAATVIVTIVSLFIYSIIAQSQTTFQKQSTTNQEINNAAYALKVMTKEIRKNPNAVSSDSSTELTINEEINFVFDKKKHVITNKNGVIFATDIQDFQISIDGKVCTIKITNLHDKTFSTKLYLRKVGTK